MTSRCAVVLALMLCGCTLGPDYVRPPVEAPPAWRISHEEAAGLIDAAWWREFDDPALADLVERAVAGNLDLMAAAARVDQFLGQWRTTRAALFPQFDAQAGISRQQDTRTGPTGLDQEPYSFYLGSLNVAWELDIWGRIRRATEAARADLLASEAGRRAVLLTLVADVTSAYLLLRGLDSQLAISRQTEQTYFESLRIFRLRHKYGTVSAVEVSQIESLYEEARQTVPAIEARIAQAENFINVLLGENPGPVARGKAIEDMVAPGIPAVLPSSLLGQRPDILLAEQNLVAANARIGVARALFFPRISLTGLLGVASANANNLFESQSKIWGVGGEALAPIFTFGRIEGQVMTAEAVQREALFRYRQAIVSAFRDVEDALAATTKGRESLEARIRRVDALESYARLSWEQYDIGTAGYLQVLDANRTLFNGRLDLVQNRVEVLTGLVDVYRAMGGGWLDAAQDAAAPDAPLDGRAEAQ